MKLRARLNKLVSFVASLSLLANSFLTPFSIAYAQDAFPTAEPTPIETSTPVVTVEPTIIPVATEEPSPTPVETIQPEITATPVATNEVTSSPTPEETVVPTFAPESTPTTTAPPQENVQPASDSSTEPSATITSTPTSTPDEPKEDGHISAVVLSDTSAASIPVNDLTVNTDGSATLQTDKADYAPTDAVLVTGSGFLADKTYTIIISSSDDPAVTHEDSVTADSEGKIVYSYQLDGNYRPNYIVEIKSGAIVVATTTFTDSPASGCTIDSGGANDEVNQKDLTKMCVNYSTTSESVTWNWDDTEFSGSNTGDACGLYDTDGDGLANYALCVGISGTSAAWSYTKLYSCSDNSAKKCTSPNTEITSFTSSCSASGSATDPFSAGNAYPNDTQANCTVNLSDFTGASAASLVDVCSFESGSPTSNPADCILFKANAGKLTVTKILSPSTDPGLFNLQIDGTTQAANVGDGGTTLIQEVSSTSSHTVGETEGTSTLLSNYTSSVVCKDAHGTGSVVTTTGTNPWTLTVADGTDVLCTITNTRINNGSITIIKDAVPNDAQDFSFTTTGSGLSSFNLDDDSDATISNTKVFSDLAAGTYSVTETAVSGWDQTSAVCDDGSPADSIVLSAGENVTCTFINTAIAPKLTVTKVVINDNGGTKGVSDFPLFIDSTSVISGVQNTVSAGSHTVSETTDSGYTSAITGDCAADGTITLALGDVKSCTITNDDKAATLIVKKVVVTDNGGTLEAEDFTFTVNDGTEISFEADGQNDLTVNAGTYIVTEPAVSGYATTYDNCSGVVIPNGGTATCTITNNDQAAHLIVIKQVINNNGGTADASDFTVNVTADNPSDDSFPGVEDPGTSITLDAGSYGVDEGTHAGYEKTLSADCAGTVNLGETKTCTITNDDIQPLLTITKVVINNNGGDKVISDFPLFVNATQVTSGVQGGFDTGDYVVSETGQTGYSSVIDGDCDAQGNVSLAIGDVKSCTITNDDVAPTLTLIKAVLNDNGGTKVVSDFPLFINGVSATSGVTYPLIANTLYTATETQYPGYQASSWGRDCATDGTITLQPGDSKTCTILNDDISPTLTLIKSVFNNYGGNNVIADFNLYIGTLLVTSGVSNVLSAGSYVASEDQLSGYTPSNWGGDCSVDGGITLLPGDNKTCTITNSDTPASITLTKVIINDNGGVAGVNDFGLSVGGTPVNSGVTTQVNSNIPIAINEIGLTGYTFVSITGDAKCPSILGGAVTLDEGENVSCTITNDDIAPTLKLVKSVTKDDGGTAVSGDWTLTARRLCVAGDFDPSCGFSDTGDSTTFHTLMAGRVYNLSESGPSGYSMGSWSCDGGSLNGNKLTLSLNDEVICTITNDDIAPTITLIKSVTNDNGGNAGENDFGLTIGATVVTSGQTLFVNANQAYALNEAGLNGYQFVSLDGEGCPTQLGDTVTLNEGDSLTCTITNDDIAPTITLIKEVRGDEEVSVDEFGLTIGDTSVNSGEVLGVDANTPISLNESGLDGYSFDSITGDEACPAELGGTVTLDEGENITCTIINTRDTGNIEGYKFEDVNGDGVWGETESGLDGWIIELWNDQEVLVGSTETLDDPLGQYFFENIPTGDYEVCEVLKDDGWQQTYPGGCHSFTLTKEGVQDLNFGNFELGRIMACKYNDLNGNGQIDDENTIGGVTINLSVWDEENTEWFPVDSQPTGENGCVIFSGLSVGDYQISEEIPTGYYQTNPLDPDYFEKLVESGTDVIYNFLNSPYRSISGQKYNDVNGNGQKDLGEPGLQDWTIYIDGNFNGVFDDGDIGTTTDADGNYQFTNLVSDMYRIREVVNTGWTQTEPSSSYYDIDLHDIVGSEGNVFGNFELASIGDFIWQDNNGDGFEDPGEPGMAGIDVKLYKDDGDGIFEPGTEDELVGTETTDGVGGYLFGNLGPGGYWVDVVDSTLPAGYVNTTLDPVGPIVLASGEVYLLADEGFVPPAKEVKIDKTNDRSNTFAGDTVTYTLSITTGSELNFGNIKVNDVLPGGFTYVAGSTVINSSPSSDPSISGGVLEWVIDNPEFPLTISYKAIIASDLSVGTYKNFATCAAFVNKTEETIDCNVDDSSVTLGKGIGYGGSLNPQVLGASTELPATGSATWILLLAGMLGIFGVGLKIYGKKRYAKN